MSDSGSFNSSQTSINGSSYQGNSRENASPGGLPVSPCMFVCAICEARHLTMDGLCSHLAACHTPDMPYRCGLCEEGFFEVTQLGEHVVQSHTVVKPYGCGRCNVTFAKTKDLAFHIAECLDSTPGVCGSTDKVRGIKIESYCSSKSDEDSLDVSFAEECQNLNSRTKDSKQDIDTKSGMTGTSQKDNIKSGLLPAANLKSKVRGLTPCAISGEEADQNSGNTTLHAEAKGQLFPDSVSTYIVRINGECDGVRNKKREEESSVDISSLCNIIEEPSVGLRKRHKYECKQCGKVYKDRFAIIYHAKMHSNERDYQCEFCPRSFRLIYQLESHLISHRKERPFVCDRCAKGYNRKACLLEHIRLKHTKDQLFHCPHCSYTSATRKELTRHKRSHGRVPKYRCNECGKESFNHTDSVRHQQTHTKEKLYECEVCHLKFTLLSNARKHMARHTRNNVHECPTCKRRFASDRILGTHQRKHIREEQKFTSALKRRKPFACPNCPKSYISQIGLKEHLRKHFLANLVAGRLPGCKKCGNANMENCTCPTGAKVVPKKVFSCVLCCRVYTSEVWMRHHLRSHLGCATGSLSSASLPQRGKKTWVKNSP